MGRRGGVASGLLSGIATGLQLGRVLREGMDRRELSEAMQGATKEDKTTVAEVEAPDAQNYTKDSETGNYAPSLAAVQSGVSESLPQIVEPKFEQKTERVDRQFASPADKRTAMLQAGVDHLIAKGEPEKAYTVASNLAKMTDQEQRQSDEKELRGLFSSGRLSVQNALPARSEEQRSSIGTGGDASSILEHKQAPAEGTIQAQAEGKGAEQQYTLDTYLKQMAPRAVQTLLKQGKLVEAKQFSEFVETEQGRAYAGKWIEGVRLHAIGDSAGALKRFESMYNDQLYKDGNTVRLVPLGDGKQYRIDQIGADGKVIGSRTGETATLANQAAMALSPMSAVKFHAEQQAQREKEGALLDRQIQIKQIDAQRDEMREDRRDERLVTRLNADAAKREATGGLTPTQQRQNAEIDAARETVAGMDPAEIRNRTAKTTDTGRENPDYDPTLAKAASLAGRRKIGQDDLFDQQRGGRKEIAKPQPAQSRSRDEIAKEFRNDRKMDSYRLGQDTSQGVEVLDRQGRVVGHFN